MRKWRDESATLVEAKQKNEKVAFFCASCGEPSDAPAGTQRSQLTLCKLCLGKRADRRANELNDLSGSEWAALSKSVEQYTGVRSEKQRAHGAAFPQSLAEAQIKTYSKQGDLVLDPFLGVGTTCDAAKALNRRSIGIELNPSFAKLARADLGRSKDHQVICGDVRQLNKHVTASSVDLVLTSPPYATLLKTVKGNFAYKWREHSDLSVVANPQPYSRSTADLGNLEYPAFMDEMTNVLRACHTALKPNTYCVWVVKDYRDLKNGVPYINFHGDVIAAGQLAGFDLWDIRIYDQTKFRPLVVLGYPSRNYYLNIGHSYILVFKKPNDARKVRDGRRRSR